MELIHYHSADRSLKNPRICQFWAMNHAAGKSGQILSVASSFTHESLEQFALSLQYVQETKIRNEKWEKRSSLWKTLVRLTLLIQADMEFIRYQKAHIISNF